MYISVLDCCGMAELADIGTHKKNISEVISRLPTAFMNSTIRSVRSRPFAQFVFSESNRQNPRPGLRLMRYIKEHQLGTVIRTKPVLNLNSQNKIRSYVWTVDWDKTKEHLDKLGVTY